MVNLPCGSAMYKILLLVKPPKSSGLITLISQVSTQLKFRAFALKKSWKKLAYMKDFAIGTNPHKDRAPNKITSAGLVESKIILLFFLELGSLKIFLIM